MAKRQTRRTVSMSRAMMDAALIAAGKAGVPLSQYTHEALASRMVAEGIEAPRHLGLSEPKPRFAAPRNALDVVTEIRRQWGMS